LESVEWSVRWPIAHRSGKTYNPDFWCETLKCFIEVATSCENICTERRKWEKAIAAGYALKVFWWRGNEITRDLDGAMRLARKDRGIP
jgi:hypothetical protein